MPVFKVFKDNSNIFKAVPFSEGMSVNDFVQKAASKLSYQQGQYLVEDDGKYEIDDDELFKEIPHNAKLRLFSTPESMDSFLSDSSNAQITSPVNTPGPLMSLLMSNSNDIISSIENLPPINQVVGSTLPPVTPAACSLSPNHPSVTSPLTPFTSGASISLAPVSPASSNPRRPATASSISPISSNLSAATSPGSSDFNRIFARPHRVEFMQPGYS